MIPKLQGIYFDWTAWRAGSVADLGIVCREQFILANKKAIKQHAIGYCLGTDVLCRPKKNSIAVMFNKDNIIFWNHFTIKEFQKIFDGGIA
jgi:hypothetical protein